MVVSQSGEPLQQLDGVVLAMGFVARLRGWFGYQLRSEVNAVWLMRTSSVHTIAMKIPLDLIWLDNEGVCLRVDPEVRPGRLCRCGMASQVVEARCRVLAVQPGQRCIVNFTQG